MLHSILNLSSSATISIESFFICTIVSIILGLGIAGIYMFRNEYNKNFVITLALLPAMVQIVIMLVNGNLGTGVAVMGAFSLVRFRSLPGTAKDISSIFFAMAIGLANGMGYIGYACLFLLIVGAVTILLTGSRFGEQRVQEKELKITIPENLDYNGIFDDLFQEYTGKSRLNLVRTTNMGSLYELQYRIQLKDESREKEFMDKLRCRNGNLNIVCGRIASRTNELL